MMAPSVHFPVMCSEVVAMLAPQAGQIVVDGTFGAGGYARAILERAPVTLYGIDRDPDALKRGVALQAAYPTQLKLIAGEFGDMGGLLAQEGITQVDGIVLDLGVSSPQLDEAHRGFSFQSDGPLDMRMSSQGMSAADVLAGHSEEDIADILWRYGQEKRSRAIARAIVRVREETPLDRTQALAELVRKIVGYQPNMDGATRTFMALRIYVNDELGELERALKTAESLLKPGGRIVVVSFHSLEDRIVKNAFSEKVDMKACASRYHPGGRQAPAEVWKVLTNKPMTAGPSELAINPRSRSAKLRAAERLSATTVTKEECA
jgi:16S rRNA (cytosine1402-N4)-methyltransferase